jgi:hypothetical protein
MAVPLDIVDHQSQLNPGLAGATDLEQRQPKAEMGVRRRISGVGQIVANLRS